MLPNKDLNLSTANARLYNEAFTSRAKVIDPVLPTLPCEDHAAAACPHNQNPPYVVWLPPPYLVHTQSLVPPTPTAVPATMPGVAQTPYTRNEFRQSFNEN